MQEYKSFLFKFLQYYLVLSQKNWFHEIWVLSVLKIRRGNRDNFGIVIHISPLKHNL